MSVNYKLSFAEQGGTHTIQADANSTPAVMQVVEHDDNKGRYHGSALATAVRGNVRRSVSGEYTTRMDFSNMHLFLASVLGELTTTPGAGTDESHAVLFNKTKQAIQLKELVNSDIKFYENLLVNSISISGSAETTNLEVTVNFVGKNRTDGAAFSESLTFAYDNLRYGIWSDVTWQIDTGAGYADFTECLKAFTITINNNYQPIFCFDSNGYPARFSTEDMTVECDFTLEYQDETYHDLMEAATTFALKFKCEDTGTALDTGVYPKVEIEIHENYFNPDFTKEIHQRDRHIQTLKAVGIGDSETPASFIDITVVNNVA